MDLSSLETTKEAVFVALLHPVTLDPITDEESKEKVGVFLFGEDSEQYKRRRQQLTNKRITKAEASLKARGKLRASATAEELDKEAIETLAVCIKSFQHVVLDGRKLNDTHEDKILFLERLPWAKDQIDEEIVNRANFMKSSQVK